MGAKCSGGGIPGRRSRGCSCREVGVEGSR